jgi:hypothetical protein
MLCRPCDDIKAVQHSFNSHLGFGDNALVIALPEKPFKAFVFE